MASSSVAPVNRAGLGQRLIALVLDAALICIPLQIVLIILFAQTNGAVQGSFGFNTKECQPVTIPPQSLDPPLPPEFNSIVDCRVSLFGFDMERTLIASKVTTNGTATMEISQEYYLGADGKPIDAWSVDEIVVLIFLAYLVIMDSRRGATFGKQFFVFEPLSGTIPLASGFPLSVPRFVSWCCWPRRFFFFWLRKSLCHGHSIGTPILSPCCSIRPLSERQSSAG